MFRHSEAATLRSSLGVLFAIGVTMTLSGRIGSGQMTMLDARLALVLAGPTFLGMWLSRRVHAFVNGALLKTSVLSVSALAGSGLLLRAVL